MTNREWLETLTDEEFAKWHQTVGCGSCAHNPEKGLCVNISDSEFDEDLLYRRNNPMSKS